MSKQIHRYVFIIDNNQECKSYQHCDTVFLLKINNEKNTMLLEGVTKLHCLLWVALKIGKIGGNAR